MGAHEQTVGGGSAKGLGKDVISWLAGGLNNGQFGGGAIDATRGITGIINQFTNADFTDPNSTALMKLANFQRMQGVNDMRSRYSLGGTGYGTPAASGEALYGAQFDNQLIANLGQQKMNVALQLLNIMAGLGSKGIPQAQTVMQPGFLDSALGTLTGVAGAIPGVMSAFPKAGVAALPSASVAAGGGTSFTTGGGGTAGMPWMGVPSIAPSWGR